MPITHVTTEQERLLVDILSQMKDRGFDRNARVVLVQSFIQDYGFLSETTAKRVRELLE